MKRFLFILSLIILSLSASPRKIRTKHFRPSSDHVSVHHVDTVSAKNYILYIDYEDSIPKHWDLVGSGHAVRCDSDPREWPVFFNARAPKYFHSQFDCKKIGEYRKLDEVPIEKFLKSHKETLLCPECTAKNPGYFRVSQILLSD